MFTVSCEINPPSIPDSGTISFQRPATPQNVKVLSGSADKIVVTWDPVENASYYVVEGAVSSDFGERFSVFGNTTTTRFEIDKGSEIRSDRSYIFTVRAITRFSNGKTFASLNSEYVEGALAPEAKDIQFYSVVTNDTVSAYWNIPTLFPTLHGDKTLYDAAFTLSYKLRDSEADPWHEIRDVDVNSDPDTPWMFHQIDINRSSLKQNENYLFRIGVSIKGPDGAVLSTVHSEPISLLLHSDRLPSAIDKIDATKGTSTEGIKLEWKVPEWTLPLNTDNCFFLIERQQEGSSEWVKVVDEITSVVQSDKIVRTADAAGIVSASFIDNDIDALIGKKFTYRITNAAFDSGVLYQQTENITEIKEAAMFFAAADGMSGVWNPASDGFSGEMTLSWTFSKDVTAIDLKPILTVESLMTGSDIWVLEDTREIAPGAFTQGYGEGIREKDFRYKLELRKGSKDGEVYYNYGYFPVEGMTGTYPRLKSDAIPAAIETIAATKGTSYEGITLNFNLPSWKFPLDGTNDFLRIERQKVGEDGIWTTLVDEISTEKKDSSVVRSISTEGVVSITYTDADIEKLRHGKFVYRVTNAARHKDIFYTQTAESSVTEEAYVFEAEAVKNNITWTPNSTLASADVLFGWSFTPELGEIGLKPVIITESKTPERPEWIVEKVFDAVNGTVTQEFGDGITSKEFRYKLQLRIGDKNGAVYSDYGYFSAEGFAEGEFPKIEVSATDKVMVENVSASDDRVGRIIITFDEVEAAGIPKPYSYAYSLDDGQSFTATEATVVSGNTREIVVEVSEIGPVNVILRTQGGKLLYSASPVVGHILDTPEGLNLATKVTEGNKVTLTWDPTAAEAGIAYNILYRAVGNESWKYGDALAMDAGTADVDFSKQPAGNYEFTLSMKNTSHADEGSANATAVTTRILPVVEGIKASKGMSKDSVTVTWNAVENATAYDVYRYTDDITSRVKVGDTVSADGPLSCIDIESTGETRYVVIASDAQGSGKVQSVFGTSANLIGNMEESNLGYRYGTSVFVPTSVSLISAEGYLSDYFTVSFNPDKFVGKYTVTATDGDMSYTFDLGTFQPAGSVRTNGKGETEVGYGQYDPRTNTASFNVRFNYLDPGKDYNNYRVKDVGVIGVFADGTSSEKKYVSGETARSLGERDYANLFNIEIGWCIGQASGTFGGDWYGGKGAFDNAQRTHNGAGFKIGNTYSSAAWTDEGKNGYITFNGYNGTYAALDSTSNISLVSTNGGKSGYLDVDPLNVIGTNPDGNSTKMTLNLNYTVNGTKVVFEPATVQVRSIKKEGGWTGNYRISIGGKPAVDITINDRSIQNKPY